MTDLNVDVLNPFGPRIFKIQLSKDVINKLTDITDKLIGNFTKPESIIK